jgi:hypothetical protein
MSMIFNQRPRIVNRLKGRRLQKKKFYSQTANFDFLMWNDFEKLNANLRETQETSLAFEKPTTETTRNKTPQSAIVLVKTTNL